MMPTSQPDLFAREQFRLCRLQVFNWGTFSDLHDIPIAERGFLFVGRSGTGKSTLLDAFSALLVPPKWLDFNAAAREADRSGRDRNLATYIRGAWAEQKDDESGEIATRYLRTGTTWSALALSYRNEMRQTVVLVQLFWLRGNTNSNAEVKRHYLVFERPFDLREMESFGRSNYDIRKLKQSFPDAFARDEFSSYRERFCRLLGIESEMALRLLHKTQSAKNLGDLNTFLRDFMLDKPATFEVAERLVSEFAELHAAHQAVITAREQVQVLAPARDEYQRLQTLQRERSGLEELMLGIDSYREGRRKALLADHIKTLRVQADGLAGEIQHQENSLAHHNATLRDLEQQHREVGGDRIEQWQAEKSGLELQRDERLRKRDQAQETCKQLGWPLPDSPQGFAELVGKARQEVEDWQQLSNATQTERDELVADKKEAEKNFALACKEVTALKRQPSNIPADMLELRRMIAAAIRLPESALPFAGELIEVRPQEAPWQGAIERVLRGFALSLLVEERHYAALSNYLNTVNLGSRLVYYRVGQQEMLLTRQLAANSLIHKLNIKPGNFAAWLEAELKQRFDYACVETLPAFRNAERALTKEGQVRHGKSRHEKDDRHRIDDRRYWVLGFNNREKLALFERQAQDLADTISRLSQAIEALAEKNQQRMARAMHCQLLANIQWQELDVAPLLDRIAMLERQVKETQTGNTTLQQLSQRIEQQQQQLQATNQKLNELKIEQGGFIKQIKDHSQALQDLEQNSALVPLTPHQRQGLEERFAKLNNTIELKNLDQLTTTVVQALSKEIETSGNNINASGKAIENCFADFKRQWPMEAGDMDASLASAPDFFAKLQRLETDGLPTHEQRFFELLQTQSHQNLAALSTHLNQARKAILERMELVNASLSQAPFNPGTYLHIDVHDRQLPEVRVFKQEIQQALSNAWTDDPAQAETRFLILQRLVAQLASQEPEMRRWREAMLDVRQHVEFIGRELDENGKEIEIYRSGAGKSGGQRQKLATTCLAAALRYQLGGHDHGVPLYAPVILDEAFDKADNEFTALAMNIFTNFGFQMIVATPLKSVMTLEPFIGGACFVDISERRHSGVLLIEYDTERQRLQLPEQVHDNPTAEVS